jgi:hypothetical protein
MASCDALVKQICALPLAERLQIRAAIDESVEQDLVLHAPDQSQSINWSATREQLEAELQRGLDSGLPIPVNEAYWLELKSRIEQRRRMAAA